MNLSRKRSNLIIVSLIMTFVVMRLYLHAFPGTNFDVAGYNIHHLYTGVVILLFCGMPLILFHNDSTWMKAMCVGFGVGLSLILDEWVYLITTDGSDQSYLLPISLWGGVVMIALAAVYIFILSRLK